MSLPSRYPPASAIDPYGRTTANPGGGNPQQFTGRENDGTDRKSQVAGLTYDGLGRVTRRGYGANIGSATAYTSTITYPWDAGARVTQIADTAIRRLDRSRVRAVAADCQAGGDHCRLWFIISFTHQI